MNKPKRSRPLLLEQLEDRSLFAASMMWFVSTDHDTQNLRAFDGQRGASESTFHRDQSSLETYRGFDRVMPLEHATTELNRYGQMDSRHDRPSIPVSTFMPSLTETSTIVIPVFQVAFKPAVDASRSSHTSGTSAISSLGDTSKPFLRKTRQQHNHKLQRAMEAFTRAHRLRP